jgi:hypothetical protein
MRTGKPSKRRARRSPTVAKRARDREDEIVQRRLRGQSFSTIADAMKMSVSACHESFWRALSNIPVKSVEQYRLESLQRLELLREAAWKHAKPGRLPPPKIIALLVLIEDRRCKLLGLNAIEGYDPTAPPIATPDRDLAVRQAQQNLSADELRTLIALMRKASGKLDSNELPAIETTATPTPENPIAQAIGLPPSKPPVATGMVAQSDEPQPPRYVSLIDFIRRCNLDDADPVNEQAFGFAQERWIAWHNRHCVGGPDCVHYSRR